MPTSRPFYDSSGPPDAMLDVVYDAVSAVFGRRLRFADGLVDVAGLVSRNLRGADGAGLALVQDGAVVLRGGSSSVVDAADDVQYGLSEGPCLTAVAEAHPVRVDSLSDADPRWPRFAHGVRHLGIGSVLSLPLVVRAGVIGSINLYSLRHHAFLEADAVNGERIARPVAAAVRTAQVSQHLHELVAQLHETLEQQAQVHTAIGVLRYQENLSAEAAHDRLGDLAAERGQSLAETAAAMLEDRDEAGAAGQETAQ